MRVREKERERGREREGEREIGRESRKNLNVELSIFRTLKVVPQQCDQ